MIDNPPATLADVQDRIRALIPGRRGSQIVCSIGTVARAGGVAPKDVPATIEAIAPLYVLGDKCPPGVGVGRWRGAKSHCLSALEACDIYAVSARTLVPCTATLRHELDQLPDHCRRRVMHLAVFLAARGLSFEDLTAELGWTFYEEMIGRDDLQNPHEEANKALRIIDCFRPAFPYWRQAENERVDKRDRIVEPDSEYSDELKADIQAMVAEFRNPTGGRASGRLPLAKKTAEKKGNLILRAASAIAREQQRSLYAIKTVREVVTVENLDCYITFSMRRGNREQSACHDDMVEAFCAAARYYLRLPISECDDLEVFHDATSIETIPSTKTTNLLRCFRDNEALRDSFRLLPEDTIADLQKIDGPLSKKDRNRAESAVALSIMLCAPLHPRRLSSLVDSRLLMLDTRLSQPTIDGQAVAPFDRRRVKDQYELSSEAQVAYGWFAEAIMQGRPFVFAGRSGSKRPANLGKQIRIFCAKFLEHLSLPVTLTQIRALIGYLYLLDYPDDLETVRRLLGHKARATTEAYFHAVLKDGGRAPRKNSTANSEV